MNAAAPLDVVVVDEMAVAVEQDCQVGRVVNGVTGDAVADAFDGDGGGVGACPAAEVMDVIAAGEVAGGGEGAAIAAVEFDGAIAGEGYDGVFDAVAGPALDNDSAIAEVA